MGFLLSLLIGQLFVTGTIALVFGSYALARRVLHPGEERDRTHDVAANVATRIAALHGLILALVYAQELDDYKGIRNGLTAEATAISDVYNDMGRYGGDQVEAVRTGLARYVSLVINEEWDLLGKGEGLAGNAWTRWDEVYLTVLDLQPIGERQSFLAGRMRQRMTDIAALREAREAVSIAHFSGLFWAPAIIGLILLAVPLYVYRPIRSHLVLMGAFGAYSGVILFFIYGFSDPFRPPGMLQPTQFERLLEGDIGKSLPPDAD